MRIEYPVIAGYRFLQTVAHSPRSEVYVAFSEELGHNVAIKVQRTSANDSGKQEAERFQRERNLLMHVKHQGIVDIYDWGETEGFHYLVTEYFPAGSLELRVRNLMSVSDSVSVLLQIASALSAVHAGGLCHRDLKPANVMMRQDGSIVLIDFGLAKQITGGAPHLTMAGEVRGSPYYISPEQATGETVDQRSDLYSLGVMFFEMLTGSRPYNGANVISIIEAHRTQPIPRLPEALAHFQKVIDGLLAKNPAERFPSVAAMIGELGKLKI